MLFLCSCGKSEEAKNADSLISAIGTVSLESESQIKEAENAVDILSEKDKKSLDGLQTLQDARAKYDELVALKLKEEHKAAVQKVENTISALGEITLQSGSAIANARKLYNDAEDDVRKDVSNYLLLTNAEQKYENLLIEQVETLISEIGEVTLDSKEKITKAKEAFSHLEDESKLLVSNQTELEEAENAYEVLLAEAKRKAAIEEARSIIRVKRLWFSRPDSAGGVELYFNFTNNSDKVIKYINFGATFYNAVGDIATCSIKRQTINYCTVTGPYAKGKGMSGSNYYWGKFYSWQFATVKLSYLNIEYMDGSEVTLSNEQLEYVQY